MDSSQPLRAAAAAGAAQPGAPADPDIGVQAEAGPLPGGGLLPRGTVLGGHDPSSEAEEPDRQHQASPSLELPLSGPIVATDKPSGHKPPSPRNGAPPNPVPADTSAPITGAAAVVSVREGLPHEANASGAAPMAVDERPPAPGHPHGEDGAQPQVASAGPSSGAGDAAGAGLAPASAAATAGEPGPADGTGASTNGPDVDAEEARRAAKRRRSGSVSSAMMKELRSLLDSNMYSGAGARSRSSTPAAATTAARAAAEPRPAADLAAVMAAAARPAWAAAPAPRSAAIAAAAAVANTFAPPPKRPSVPSGRKSDAAARGSAEPAPAVASTPTVTATATVTAPAAKTKAAIAAKVLAAKAADASAAAAPGQGASKARAAGGEAASAAAAPSKSHKAKGGSSGGAAGGAAQPKAAAAPTKPAAPTKAAAPAKAAGPAKAPAVPAKAAPPPKALPVAKTAPPAKAAAPPKASAAGATGTGPNGKPATAGKSRNSAPPPPVAIVEGITPAAAAAAAAAAADGKVSLAGLGCGLNAYTYNPVRGSNIMAFYPGSIVVAHVGRLPAMRAPNDPSIPGVACVAPAPLRRGAPGVPPPIAPTSRSAPVYLSRHGRHTDGWEWLGKGSMDAGGAGVAASGGMQPAAGPRQGEDEHATGASAKPEAEAARGVTAPPEDELGNLATTAHADAPQVSPAVAPSPPAGADAVATQPGLEVGSSGAPVDGMASVRYDAAAVPDAPLGVKGASPSGVAYEAAAAATGMDTDACGTVAAARGGKQLSPPAADSQPESQPDAMDVDGAVGIQGERGASQDCEARQDEKEDEEEEWLSEDDGWGDDPDDPGIFAPSSRCRPLQRHIYGLRGAAAVAAAAAASGAAAGSPSGAADGMPASGEQLAGGGVVERGCELSTAGCSQVIPAFAFSRRLTQPRLYWGPNFQASVPPVPPGGLPARRPRPAPCKLARMGQPLHAAQPLSPEAAAAAVAAEAEAREVVRATRAALGFTDPWPAWRQTQGADGAAAAAEGCGHASAAAAVVDKEVAVPDGGELAPPAAAAQESRAAADGMACAEANEEDGQAQGPCGTAEQPQPTAEAVKQEQEPLQEPGMQGSAQATETMKQEPGDGPGASSGTGQQPGAQELTVGQEQGEQQALGGPAQSSMQADQEVQQGLQDSQAAQEPSQGEEMQEAAQDPEPQPEAGAGEALQQASPQELVQVQPPHGESQPHPQLQPEPQQQRGDSPHLDAPQPDAPEPPRVLFPADEPRCAQLRAALAAAPDPAARQAVLEAALREADERLGPMAQVLGLDVMGARVRSRWSAEAEEAFAAEMRQRDRRLAQLLRDARSQQLQHDTAGVVSYYYNVWKTRTTPAARAWHAERLAAEREAAQQATHGSVSPPRPSQGAGDGANGGNGGGGGVPQQNGRGKAGAVGSGGREEAQEGKSGGSGGADKGKEENGAAKGSGVASGGRKSGGSSRSRK